MSGITTHRPLTSRHRPEPRDQASGFLLMLWGVIVYTVHIRIDGFDLLPDVVGCGLIVVGTYRVEALAAEAFSRARWCVAVLGVFSLNRLTSVRSPGDSSFLTGPVDWGLTLGSIPVLAVAENLVLVIAGWWIMAGITRAAQNQGRRDLARRGVALQRHLLLSLAALVVLPALSRVFLGSATPVLALGLFLWILVRLLLLLGSARNQLTVRHGPQLTAPPATALELLGFAAMVVVGLIGLTINLSLSDDQPDQANQDDWAFSRPETIYDRAVANQAPGLIVAPATLVPEPEHRVPGASCATDPSTLAAVDPGTGAVVWQHPVPAAVLPPIILDDAVLVTSPHLDYGRLTLPSVASIGLVDGALRWQRVLDGEQVPLIHPVEGGVAVELIAGASNGWSSVTVSPDGTLTTTSAGPPSSGWPYHFSASVPGPDGTTAVITAGVDSRLRLERGDGSVVVGDEIPFDETFTSTGNPTSPGDPVQVGRDHVLVVLGSPAGPNSRIAVYRVDTGALVWTLDHVRSAALGTLAAGSTGAGTEVIVYDKRNTAPPTAPSTRDLFVVSADDPDEVLWTAPLSVNDLGGNGYLGSTTDGLVFALDGDDDRLDLLTVAGPETPAPALIRAAEGVGGGPSPTRHAGPDPDGLVAIADGDTLVIHTSGETRRFEQDAPIRYITRAADHLLLVTATNTATC